MQERKMERGRERERDAEREEKRKHHAREARWSWRCRSASGRVPRRDGNGGSSWIGGLTERLQAVFGYLKARGGENEIQDQAGISCARNPFTS